MFIVYATDFPESRVSHFILCWSITFVPPKCPDVEMPMERGWAPGVKRTGVLIVTAGNVTVPSKSLGYLLSVMFI